MIYIEQPPFLPWLGFCEAMLACETIALYDSVQFSERGWQNRNRIKTANGPAWLTVPVRKRHGQLLRDVRVSPSFDPGGMLETIRHAYARSEFYREALEVIAGPLQSGSGWLVDLNVKLVTAIGAALGSTSALVLTSGIDGIETDDRIERIIKVCHAEGGGTLWAGEGTRGYLDTGRLADHGVSVVWNEFPMRHPAYPQNWARQGFMGGLSVIDAACNLGWAGASAMLRQGLSAYLAASVMA